MATTVSRRTWASVDGLMEARNEGLVNLGGSLEDPAMLPINYGPLFWGSGGVGDQFLTGKDDFTIDDGL